MTAILARSGLQRLIVLGAQPAKMENAFQPALMNVKAASADVQEHQATKPALKVLMVATNGQAQSPVILATSAKTASASSPVLTSVPAETGDARAMATKPAETMTLTNVPIGLRLKAVPAATSVLMDSV